MAEPRIVPGPRPDRFENWWLNKPLRYSEVVQRALGFFDEIVVYGEQPQQPEAPTIPATTTWRALNRHWGKKR